MRSEVIQGFPNMVSMRVWAVAFVCQKAFKIKWVKSSQRISFVCCLLHNLLTKGEATVQLILFDGSQKTDMLRHIEKILIFAFVFGVFPWRNEKRKKMEQRIYKGLGVEEVIESRRMHGANVLTPPERIPLWRQYLDTFGDPLIRILLVALFLSICVSTFQVIRGLEGLSVFLEPAGVLLAILLATGVGFGFTTAANRKFDILNKVNDDTLVKVIRGGQISTVSKRDIVVGDIVLLESGEEIPADGELLESTSLNVDESTLTGEPMTMKTSLESAFDLESTYPSNHLYKGTTVLEGHGLMRVLAVGDGTESGKVDQKSRVASTVVTPLNLQLTSLARLITLGSYLIAGLIILARLLMYFINLEGGIDWLNAGSYILHTLMIAITVIVVAVPEGLPMAVTLSLALSMKRMLSTNNLVRKLHACETMGAATVICTDKTGTLTENRMRVYEPSFFSLQGGGLTTETPAGLLIAEGIAINSTAHLDVSTPDQIKTIGNPTEAALLLWLHDQQIDYMQIRQSSSVLEQLPFSTENKYMATVARSSQIQGDMLYVKGAPEVILSMCQHILEDGETPLTDVRRTLINAQLTGYQGQGMRTLGFACKRMLPDAPCIRDGRVISTDLVFLGIVAISDPVRADVPAAVRSCFDAGISVKIVTGDTPGTAKEIGRQIGLWSDADPSTRHMTGVEFAETPDDILLDSILDLKIISRARPMDKERLVKLLQQKGQVVAVTGDGTNDAPALNAAQVGLSMGDGTSVAKQASDITILDNSFHSITRAVMWGRSLYQNIRRFILFQMTINVAACLIVLIGAFLGTESPLTVTQMLWVNLIMDTFAALALASLPPNEAVMKDRPRRTTDHIISRPMLHGIIGVGLSFVVILFGLLQYFKHVEVQSLLDFDIRLFLSHYFDFRSVPNGLSPYELSLFFTFFVMLQFWNMFNAKAFNTGRSTFSGLRDTISGFGLVALLIIGGQYLIVTLGDGMFNVVPLSAVDWLLTIVATSFVLWFGELFRLFKKL
jgi:Ca2+-transporting ATPase